MLLERFLLKTPRSISEPERRKILLAGYFFLISIVLRAFFGVVNIFNPEGQVDKLYLFGGVFFSLTCLLLLRAGWINLPIVAHLLFSNVMAYRFTYADPDRYQTATYLFFLPSALWAVAIFGYRERVKGFLFAGLSFVLFLLAILDPPRYHVADAHFYFITNFIIILVIGVFILNYYDKQVLKSESALQIKNDELVKINAELDRFVYSASHDLRAPLSSITGLINLYQLGAGDEKDKMVDLIKNRVDKLDLFTQEIIQYSRNIRQEINPSSFLIHELIHESWEKLKYIPQAHPVKFLDKTEPTLQVHHDKDRIRVILENLISNGIKYAKQRQEESFIAVNAGIIRDKIVLEIQDNGIGIEKTKQPKVFDMFYRAHENSDGSGLGLFIVNEMVTKMKGRIEMESSESTGTRFIIHLPMLDNAQPLA
jgi:signal transduction histidine kinase